MATTGAPARAHGATAAPPWRRSPPPWLSWLPSWLPSLLLLSLLALLLSMSTLPSPAAAAGDTDPSRVAAQVKAAYIYRFAEHIEWPPAAFADDAAPLVIAVVDADQVAAELNQLRQTRQIKGRGVTVRTLRAGDPAGAIQVLYIGAQDGARVKRTLEAAATPGVLAITDGAGTLAAGSAISFVPVDNRIRFDVSLSHAERSGLKISARLLAVAHKIEGGRQ
ncbi:YfiR family protein [Oxalobacteraceae bacterium OTU3CAMAD1]|nr:YfiR family protein [Oxalobacteraceae bacterium OTU3CAMAD1]